MKKHEHDHSKCVELTPEQKRTWIESWLRAAIFDTVVDHFPESPDAGALASIVEILREIQADWATYSSNEATLDDPAEAAIRLKLPHGVEPHADDWEPGTREEQDRRVAPTPPPAGGDPTRLS